jgi:hypothetical protein
MPRNSSSLKLMSGKADGVLSLVTRVLTKSNGLLNMYSETINAIYCFRVGFGKMLVANFQDPSALHPFLSRISGLLI